MKTDLSVVGPDKCVYLSWRVERREESVREGCSDKTRC